MNGGSGTGEESGKGVSDSGGWEGGGRGRGLLCDRGGSGWGVGRRGRKRSHGRTELAVWLAVFL